MEPEQWQEYVFDGVGSGGVGPRTGDTQGSDGEGPLHGHNLAEFGEPAVVSPFDKQQEKLLRGPNNNGQRVGPGEEP
jgi:hypothetical protein